MKDYVTLIELSQIYDLSKYSLGVKNSKKVYYEKFYRLINAGAFHGINQDNITFISIESFEKYINTIDKIRKDYFNIHDFLIDFTGMDYNKRFISNVKQLAEKSCLELLN